MWLDEALLTAFEAWQHASATTWGLGPELTSLHSVALRILLSLGEAQELTRTCIPRSHSYDS